LLQAALSVKESELRLRVGSSPALSKGNVVPLLPGKESPVAAEVAPAKGTTASIDAKTDRLIRQREGEIEKLSQRWRELQGAYRDAVAEFDEVRERRDRLIRKLGPVAGPPAGLAAGPTAANDDDLVVPDRGPRPLVVVHLDDDDRIAAGRSLAAAVGAGFSTARELRIPARAEVIVATNLLARQLDPFQGLATLAGGDDIVRSLMYGARGDRGWVWGPVDVFPPPFDPYGCAAALHRAYPSVRRAMAVGVSTDTMNRLHEILGRWHCSTAVAFEPMQAQELIPLVRPEYVLIDLSIPECGGVELLAELSARTDAPVNLGVTWSSRIDSEAVASFLEERFDEPRFGPADFDQRRLGDALLAMVGGGRIGASSVRPVSHD